MAHGNYGYIELLVAVSGVTTAYALDKKLLLEENTSAADGLSAPLPAAGVIWSHAEIVMTVTGGSPTTIDLLFTWDAEGDDVACGPSQSSISLAAGLTTTAKRFCTPTLGVSPIAPADQTTVGKVCAFIQTDTGTVTVNRIRLHWRRAN